MSCQSLAARAFVEPDKDTMTHCSALHRTVRFSSESRSSTRVPRDDTEKRETPGSISLTALSVTPVASQNSAMSQSAPNASTFDMDDMPAPPAASCRFPKLEECAHFHYDRVCLGGLSIETVDGLQDNDAAEDNEKEGWLRLQVRSNAQHGVAARAASWSDGEDVHEWTLCRNANHFLQLDDMLHRCIYDRKVSGLPNLSEKITPALLDDAEEYRRLISDYVHHFSIIADDSINCGPVLNWLQMDNKGHRLLVANEDSSSINTPAVAAAYSVRKYVSQARDEISFEVGDMISIIDMPGPQESSWWRGKRGFRVGFFPHHCVAVIGDKVPRHMSQPPPIVGSVAVAPIKPVLRKHGKLISLFRSFILSRPSRRSLKQQGILRERVFGCDLGEHLMNCGQDVPQVVVECARSIESRGAVDGIYRLSGGAALTQRLRALLDAGESPPADPPPDPHALASLLKMYCRELPNPLCTYQLYDSFVRAVQQPDDAARLRAVRDTVVKLPPPHYRTLAYLMRHLRRVSLLSACTGMTARNMAIVWAPNLLRSPAPRHELQGVAVQAVVTEFLIVFAEELFSQEQGEDSGPDSWELEQQEALELRSLDSCRRPKSLPLHPPTKLLSLEEARARGKPPVPTSHSPSQAVLSSIQLRGEANTTPKYIDVGEGPNNLPQYHTVLDLPAGGKRGVKRSPGGWRGLFSRHKLQRARTQPASPRPVIHHLLTPQAAEEVTSGPLRPAQSCESLASDVEPVPPLAQTAHTAHTRSSSCDSYFESWQCELAHMRLRLAPQERRTDMFAEEDTRHESGASSPPESSCSGEPSPERRDILHDTDRKRTALEEQLSQIRYIDSESPRGKLPFAAEKRHCSARPASPPTDIAKRLCTDRESPRAAHKDFPSPLSNVKLRERNSPRKTKNTSRYSGMHQPINMSDHDKNVIINSRLSWHGKDGHSTLIKIDWPLDNTSISNLTNSTLNSSPLTPATPVYDPLESDSDISEAKKHSIKINNQDCSNCDEEKCLKCELTAADSKSKDNKDAENVHDSPEASPAHSIDISYQNLNRLSAVSNSSNSEPNSDRKKDYENCDLKVMTSSHESSSSYSNDTNPSKQTDDLYECYNFTRPNYINLSSSSKSSPGSPLKSPLKSTISITFRSPTKSKSPDYEIMENTDTPTNERDSVYEDIDLDKNLSIVEEATVPQVDGALPTQEACQPESFNEDLIILETPIDQTKVDSIDVYSQVKFFKKSIDEVNAMILESPEKERHYENVAFAEARKNNYVNINVESLKICDKKTDNTEAKKEQENGNIIKVKTVTNLNVRELANRFESPTEQKGPFIFERFKTDIKYPTLERNDDKIDCKKNASVKIAPPVSPKTYKLSKHSCIARSLDENAFVKEFGNDQDKRKSIEIKDVKKQNKFVPDLNLNTEEVESKVESITPTTENKICLVQRFDIDVKNIIGDTDKRLSRERIEKYKEERRIFLREKYSSQSFRSNPEQLTRIKIKKDDKADCDKLKDELPKIERRNTVDLGQRMRFSLAKSANNLDTIQSPVSPDKEEEFITKDFSKNEVLNRDCDRKEKVSPSYNIKDMAAMFEQKSQNTG